MATKNTDRLAQSQVVSLWKRPSGEIPEVVYHYTDAAGLHGILSSRRVWATDCRFLNDETESQLGLHRATQLVQALYLKEKSDRVRGIYRAFLEALRRKRENRNFIFSLSSRKDDLSQWRAYARDGKGFTIGFKSEALLSYSEEKEAYGFSKVSYNQQSFDRRLKKYITMMFDAIESSGLNGIARDDYIARTSANLEWMTYVAAVLFKHSSFMAEKEWRVNTYQEGADVKVRSAGDRLVPYVELKLCADDAGCIPVAQIGIGPGFRQSSTKFAVERLLETTGITAEIYDAETPFRRV
jgi:hypothetical protein